MKMRTLCKIVSWYTFLVLVASAWLPPGVSAHHGWGWATDEEFEITGKVIDLRLGNPHGEVSLAVENEVWVVEIGQPWRNERAGLNTEVLFVGQIMTVHGHRSAKEGDRLVKAERVVIDGKNYNLYPDRKS
jgi:hypothetical protein